MKKSKDTKDLNEQEMGKNKKTKKSLGKRILKILLRVIAVIASIYILIFMINVGASMSLRQYIKSFDPVDYSKVDRVIPEIDEETGYYALTTDRELKIMMLTDIHIGGGIWSTKQDRKTVYEITAMLQKEKPDLVILDGDNTFAVPGPVYNGGGTLNNAMVARDVITLFEHQGVYFSTVFGNHDTEVFDYTSRPNLAKVYESDKYKYCIFDSNYTDSDAKIPSVSNQIILVKNTDGNIRKSILLMDSNAYVDNSIKSVLKWDYDTIHDAQVDWAASELKKLGSPKTMAFFHIPTSEFRISYEELAKNDFKPTLDSGYISGVWDEKVDKTAKSRIWYGGIFKKKEDNEKSLANVDKFFETLGPDGMNVLESCFSGHDHVNNAAVMYKGVVLGYGYSIDNLAYDDIDKSGLQRGAVVFNIDKKGGWNMNYRNAYKDYGVSTDKFDPVYLDRYYYAGELPK